MFGMFLFPFNSPLPLMSSSASPHDHRGGTVLALVSKVLLDYATHEVPLPLFGFGHDWACTFREAPLPTLGKHELQSSLCEASSP